MRKFREVIKEYRSFDGALFRNSLTYSFLLALFPTLIIFVILFQYAILDVNVLLDYLYRFLPEKLLSPFITFIMNQTYDGFVAITLSLVTAFYVASKSVYAFLMVSAKYENFNYPRILIRIKSYVLFVFLVLCIVGIGVFLSHFIHSYRFTIFIAVFVMVYIFYRALSFEKRPYSYGLVGTTFVSIALSVLGITFFKIISMFFSYNNVYGPMASFLILLLSIHILSGIVYFGFCLNLVYGRHKEDAEYKSESLYKLGNKIIVKIKSAIKKVIFR